MERVIAAGFLVSTHVVGLIRLLAYRRELESKRQFAHEFLSSLVRYVKSQGADYEAYAWLVQRLPRMQTHLGILGIAASYRPPFANYAFSNYQIVVNTLPELRRSLQSPFSNRVALDYVAIIQECVLRHLGSLDDQQERTAQDLRNPMIWFREGIQFLLIVPALMLSWMGLITSANAVRLRASATFRLLSALVAIAGFVGAVIGIVTDWESFSGIIRQWLKSR